MERRDWQQEVATACQPVDFDNVRHFCSWIHEANDKNFTETAAKHFPSYICFSRKLESNSDNRGLILPSDIDNLFYIIRASRQVFTLQVESCRFTGSALSRFWKAVADSKTKIRSFHLQYQLISDDDSSCIVESLQHVQKLRLQKCGVSSNLVRALTEKWEEIGTNIEELDLSGNEKIGDAGFVILARLPGIRRLRLYGCDISSKGCAEFVEEMIKTNHKIEELDLSCNWKIDDAGFVSLARLPGIRRLDLIGCDISSKGCAEFAEEMIKTNHKIEELDLSGNEKIDDAGFVILARLPGIRRLRLIGCDISSKGCAEFVEEIIKTNHKIEELGLSCNWKIDDAGFVSLARLPGIRRLKLRFCDISSKDCAEFAEEMIKTNHKLEYLDLSDNRRIGDDGARSLFRCCHLIERLWLWGCDVTYAVKEEIRSELRRLNLPEHRVLFW